jgi:hypothetical protein
MAVDATTFVTEYPEFAECQTVAPALIARALRQAAGFCDARAFGSRYQDAVFCKAADILAMTPFGENARLKTDPTQSCYSVVFRQMLLALPLRMGVAGGIAPEVTSATDLEDC